MKLLEGAAVVIMAVAIIVGLLLSVGYAAFAVWEYVHDKLRQEREEDRGLNQQEDSPHGR